MFALRPLSIHVTHALSVPNLFIEMPESRRTAVTTFAATYLATSPIVQAPRASSPCFDWHSTSCRSSSISVDEEVKLEDQEDLV